jgi:hypothetical protein
MHIEFANFLAAQTLQLLMENGMRKDNLSLIEKALQRSTICKAPLDTGQVLGTDFAFKISQLLKENNRVNLSPQEIAQALAEQNNGSSTEFRLFAASTGHINASLSEDFLNLFLEKLLEKNGFGLPAQDTLVVPPAGIKPYSCRADSNLLEDIEKLIEKSGDKEINILVNSRKYQQARENNKCNSDLLVMLLAVLADEEIDAAPFLMDLKGRQNVPWLLKKFSKDWRKFSGSIDTMSGSSLKINVDDLTALNYKFQEMMPKSFKQATVGVVNELLLSRDVFFRANVRRRPDILINHLLLVVRRFYSFYNLPEYRYPRVDNTQERQEIARLSDVVKLLGLTIEQQLALLFLV